MKTKILEKLSSIELEKNITILHAIESGSRSWGFASPDSDYDIRFIYKHSMDWYLSPWEKKDTIEFMTEDALDGSGWELKKVFHLLNKSNVPLFEHLYSPIIYREDNRFMDLILPLSNDAFSPVTIAHHYLSISKKYYHYCEGDTIKLKDLFYCLRTMLAAKWVIEKDSFPPVELNATLELLPSEIKQIVDELRLIKSANDEKYKALSNHILLTYLHNELVDINSKAKYLRSGNFDKTKAEKVFIELIKN